MEPKQIIVNHENSKHGYIHWLDNENYQLLELERDVYINENKKLNDIIDKTNWWLEEMLKQTKNEETKAIISGTLELLLKDN